jgi:hypothetical protein
MPDVLYWYPAIVSHELPVHSVLPPYQAKPTFPIARVTRILFSDPHTLLEHFFYR